MTQSEQPLAFLALTVFDGRLYAINKAGEPLALYVYAPLAQAYAGRYEVPFAPSWPQYAQGLPLQYTPMPVLTPEQLPDSLEGDITQQTRDGDPVRPWAQMIYRGWPLYYVTGEQPSGSSDAQPTMFTPATVGMTPPSGVSEPDDGEGWPPSVWGP